MKSNFLANLLLVALFCAAQSCTTLPTHTTAEYSPAERLHLYLLETWSFQGRMAISSRTDSWSASIDWEHVAGVDKLRLAGPFGQGGVFVTIADNHISIDRGDGQIEFSDDPDALISRQLGLFVPVMALRYWVVGLVQPENRYERIDDGFLQSGWSVHYPQFVQAGDQLMPQKMRVEKDEISLKLVFDRWKLNG
ncbi:MAG: lipoprotein insertase outer membrane protein LolB [Gammaproteobacteria bacterium]